MMRRSSERPWRALALSMLVVVTLVTGCSEGGPEAGSLVGVGGLDPSSGTTLPDSGYRDPIQAEILSDEVVSEGEMERALLAVVQCVRDAGFQAELSQWTGTGWAFEVAGDTEEEMERGDTELNRCSSALLSDVETAFYNQNAPTEKEIQEMQQAVFTCLAEEGIDTAGLDSPSEVVDLFEAAMASGDDDLAHEIQHCLVGG